MMIEHDMMDVIAGLPTPRRLRMLAMFDLLTAAGASEQTLEFDHDTSSYEFSVTIDARTFTTRHWPTPDAAVRAIAENLLDAATCSFCDRKVAFDYLTQDESYCNYYFAMTDDGLALYYPECKVTEHLED